MPTLTPEGWQQLSPYLDQVLELPEEQRQAWLEDFASTKPELAGLLSELLKEHASLDRKRFLEGTPLVHGIVSSLAGQKIGPYTLMSPIGEGGMGTVWLAERTDGRFERSVAVKFLRFSVASKSSAERFRREGLILGQLSHPCIAELIDAGVTAKGEPYLVLEHVEGEHIDEYCDKRRLPVDARIRLFLDVLSAASHAHANLIVHRDFKPSNVLVRSDGQVKLLDFGIAKLLASDRDAPATQITQEAGNALTLQFAAPEQLTGGTITTATDVYSLGVLLYLLLTGRHPAGDGQRSAVDLVNAIAGKEPARASDAAMCGENDTAAHRGSTPIKLGRELRGDLDTILAKTLKKNPAERYLSVNLLADDLERYLHHQPISARSDSFLYRTGKFVRRNRTALTFSSIATVLVLTSLTGGMYVANRQRKIAERRFVQVRQLANKFIALDEALRGLPGTTKVRSRMVVDSLQYLNSLGNEVHGDKELALDIAYAYMRVAHTQGDPTSPNLGQFADAELSLSNASKFVDPILAKDPNDARALSIAVTIAHDRMMLDPELGHPAQQSLADAAQTASLLERYRQTPNFNAYATVYFYVNVAENYANLRYFDEAMRYSQLALQLSESVPLTRELRGSIIQVLADALWHKGDLAGALQVAREAVENQQQQAAGGHVTLRINLADSLQEQARILGRQDAEPTLERTSEALALFQKAEDIVEELATRDSSDHRSREESEFIGLEIGNILRHTNPKRALAVYDHSLARLHEMKGDALLQKDEAELLANSAYALQRLKQSQEAGRRIDQAFQLLRNVRAYPADVIEPMTDVYDVVRSSADNYVENGEITKALETYQELLEKLMRWKPHLDSDLRDAVCISRTWSAMAELLRLQHRHAEANELERQRAELWQRWQTKLPDSAFLLRQSLKQAYELPK